MFGSLQLGNLIYILDKTDGVKLKTGEVVYTGNIKPMLSNIPNQTCIDIRVNVDGSTVDYNSIPSSNSIVSYGNGSIILSESKQGLQSEVESIIHTSLQALDNIERYKKNIEECEAILVELCPLFAKDKERDTRLTNLELRFDGVSDKIDKILTLITNK